MNRILHRSTVFILLSLLWCLCAAAPLLFSSQAAIHRTINSFHAAGPDIFFTWITTLGDGWTVVPIVIALALFSYRAACSMAAANILTGFTTQVLKKTIFSGVVRPSKFFEGIATLHTVAGVQLYSFESFPSGHAATVFTICTILALRTTSATYQCVLVFVAIVTAFSRVYLSQHFLHDVAAGSLIGLMIGIGIDRAISAWALHRSSAHWLNRSVLPPGRPL